MKRLIYQVYVGKRSKLYDHCVASVKAYCEKYGIDHKVQKTPILMIKPDVFATNRNPRAWEEHGGFMPIFEKENVFDYLDDYDQICVIDGDIWVRPDSPNIFNELKDTSVHFGSVFERELPLDPKYKTKAEGYSKNLLGQMPEYDWDFNPIGEFFNSGVMLYNSNKIKEILKGISPKEFLQRSDFKPFIDGDGFYKWQGDQIMLNYWWTKENMNVIHLDWKYNALYNPNWGGILHDEIKNGYFIHFFQSKQLKQWADNIDELVRHVS